MLNLAKGQVFAPDFLASVAVFTVMLSVFILSWNSILADQEESREEQALYENAQRTMSQLLSSQGYPENWDENNVSTIGLAYSPNIIDIDKLEKMEELDESEQLSLLNTFNFKLEVIRINDENVEIGSDNTEGDLIMPLRRDALLKTESGKERVEVIYTVWQ